VVSLTNVHPRRGASPPPQRFVGFLPQAHLVFSRVVRFPQELDIELTASGGTHETIHLPFSVPPRSSLFRFPPDARLDSVIGSNFTARILYHQGTHGHFNTYTVSQLPFMTVP
jgi:hypothetical protein